MIFSCNHLYRSLQRDLSFRSLSLPSQLEEVERYFKCCFHYWMEVYQLMAGYRFCSPAEEVCFFSKVKPLFTCELEYAQLLCNAMLFLPEEGERAVYWQREGARLGGFVREHTAFCRHYRRGMALYEAPYFTRVDALSASLPARPYPDEGLVSLYDPLVGRLLALRRYNAYVQGQLSRTP